MGLSISGIAIKKVYTSKEKLEDDLNCKLEEKADSTNSYNNLAEQDCLVFETKKATLILCDPDIAVEPYAVKNGLCLSFVIEETSMSFSLNYCDNSFLKRAFKSLNDDKIETVGEEFSFERGKDDLSIIEMALLEFFDIAIDDIANNKNYKTYEIKNFKGNPVKYPEKKEEQQIIEIKEQQNHIDLKISDTNNQERTTEIFKSLTDEDKETVINTLDALGIDDINRQTLSYILNLARFHRELKVRNKAINLLEKYAPKDLWIQFHSNWDKKNLKEQNYHDKIQFENPAIDIAEYLLFAQVIRKNYYKNRDKKGMVAYISMRYNDEVENILDYYQVLIHKNSRKSKITSAY